MNPTTTKPPAGKQAWLNVKRSSGSFTAFVLVHPPIVKGEVVRVTYLRLMQGEMPKGKLPIMQEQSTDKLIALAKEHLPHVSKDFWHRYLVSGPGSKEHRMVATALMEHVHSDIYTYSESEDHGVWFSEYGSATVQPKAQ